MTPVPGISASLPDLLKVVRALALGASQDDLAAVAYPVCELAMLTLGAMLRAAAGQQEPSQGPPGAAAGARTQGDRWITPSEAAARMGRSAKWLARRWRRPPYSSFCIPQEKRGFLVSERGLAEHMERELRTHGR